MRFMRTYRHSQEEEGGLDQVWNEGRVEMYSQFVVNEGKKKKRDLKHFMDIVPN